MWSWNSNTLATWCEELTHWKRPWCWERLRAREEGDDRGWDGWMASLTQWTWVWVDSRSWCWTGRPGLLWFMGSKESDMTKWLNWTELILVKLTQTSTCPNNSNLNFTLQNWFGTLSRMLIKLIFWVRKEKRKIYWNYMYRIQWVKEKKKKALNFSQRIRSSSRG